MHSISTLDLQTLCPPAWRDTWGLSLAGDLLPEVAAYRAAGAGLRVTPPEREAEHGIFPTTLLQVNFEYTLE